MKILNLKSMLYSFFNQLFFRSWWVIIFLLLCAILYEQGIKETNRHYQQLNEQQIALQIEKQKALEKQQDLKCQINSQSDLAWIELTLMKGLGLVPEGEQKVYFYQEPEHQ